MSDPSVSAGHSVCAVKVYTRVRPVSKIEQKAEEERGASISEHGIELEPTSIRTFSNTTAPHTYNLDGVLGQDCSQQDIYSIIANDFMADVVDGYNATIFAYGQTGAGKSYTMFGPNDLQRFEDPQAGLVPRAIYDLFSKLDLARRQKDSSEHAYQVTVSYLQIYQEAVQDLLKPNNSNMRVRESPTDGVYVEGLMQAEVTTREETLDWLRMGGKNRSFAQTACNETSSRSHTLFMVTLTQTTAEGAKRQSKLCLADLAGSEKVGKSKVTGAGFSEALTINQSLSVLGHCIKQLTSSKASHVPYRESKLTYILKDSLGGNSKTALICAVSPHPTQFAETCSTLQFAERAKQIKNSVSVNTIMSHTALVATVEKLEGDLAHKRARIRQLERDLGLPPSMRDSAGSSGTGPTPRSGLPNSTPRSASSGESEYTPRTSGTLDEAHLDSAREMFFAKQKDNKVLANEARAAAQLQREADDLAQAAMSQNTVLKERVAALESQVKSERAEAVEQAEAKFKMKESETQEAKKTVRARMESLSDQLIEEVGRLHERAEEATDSKEKATAMREDFEAKEVEYVVVQAELESLSLQKGDLQKEHQKLTESSRALTQQLHSMQNSANSNADLENKAAIQIEELQTQLNVQKDRFTDDLRQAKKEMSNHSKSKLANVKAKADAATKEQVQAETVLTETKAVVLQLQQAMEDEANKVQANLAKHNTAFTELTEKVQAAEVKMQDRDLERCNTMSELSDMMQELNQKRQANKELQEDNDKLKNELLRMKKVVSNVVEDKKKMADTLLEKDATSEQIEMLRLETKRLQENSEKAHQDAMEAHKAKDELSATLEALEQNFIRKIQVTSKSNNLSAYFPPKTPKTPKSSKSSPKV